MLVPNWFGLLPDHEPGSAPARSQRYSDRRNGCAKDIVEHAAVSRFLFSDFLLGNSAGKPQDVGSCGTDA